MTADAAAVALGAILDSLTMVQAQLDALIDAGHRIEATSARSKLSCAPRPRRSRRYGRRWRSSAMMRHAMRSPAC